MTQAVWLVLMNRREARKIGQVSDEFQRVGFASFREEGLKFWVWSEVFASQQVTRIGNQNDT